MAEKVKQLTNEKGVDVVLESVGTKTWKDSVNMLRPYGRIVIAGTTSGKITTQDISDVYYLHLSILGSRMGYPHEFEKILELVNQGKLKPIIDSIFPLKEAATAQKKLENGQFVGKIVLEV